ncbi:MULTISPECIES: hypothetical protein [Sphingobacterium]|uniref:hypothetical protein n=1 Tax=Sphingobacterium TaxID=28453 RepID=UPI000E7E3E80|nr:MULTISPECIES: hypothetical protein [Sphingobacterium]HAU53052.1 hypothetical protein [Sphingobacterium sp.]
MGGKEILGKYIQRKLRGKGIEDKDVARSLNIALRSVPYIYKQTEISSERLAKISILLDENIYLDYYGDEEPLKSLLNRETNKLKELNEKGLAVIDDKNLIIELQNKLIVELEEKLKK